MACIVLNYLSLFNVLSLCKWSRKMKTYRLTCILHYNKKKPRLIVIIPPRKISISLSRTQRPSDSNHLTDYITKCFLVRKSDRFGVESYLLFQKNLFSSSNNDSLFQISISFASFRKTFSHSSICP